MKHFLRSQEQSIDSETVGKVPKQIFGEDAEKNDFTECATINDLIIMKGRETPKNQALTILKGFSTVSADMWPLAKRNFSNPHEIRNWS